jgi:CheY-like chemotaxis protein
MNPLMKILLLNPYLDASHDIVRVLQKSGMALLVSADAVEAWQMLLLHGTSVDLAIVHREGLGGTGEPGFKFISQLKQDPTQADLPFIITSEKWSNEKYAEHQESTLGANAYLKFPFSAQALIQLIEGVLGQSKEESKEEFKEEISTALPPVKSSDQAVLEEASSVFQQSARDVKEEEKIHLDAPDLSDEEELKVTSHVLSPPVSKSSEPVPEKPSPLAKELLDEAAKQVMPYLYAEEDRIHSPSFQFSQPLGDAVVPGGAAHAPDLETLKKYLLLREQDVGALSGQLKSTREQLEALEDLLRLDRAKNVELNHTVEEQKRKLNDFEKEKKVEIEVFQNEMNELRLQMKEKTDKARTLEAKMREATDETERLKDRVRGDIRKIRVREKELENRLEILKRDSEALMASRENKIIELKRKLDLYEFNMDLIQDQFTQEKEKMIKAHDRLLKASQAVRVASRILEGSTQNSEEAESYPLDKKIAS